MHGNLAAILKEQGGLRAVAPGDLRIITGGGVAAENEGRNGIGRLGQQGRQRIRFPDDCGS